MTPLERVRTLVEAAREVAADAGVVAPLVLSTGLSPEGVALALHRCLETHPTDDDLAALVGRSSPARSVHVILSANVFTAPLRALAVACASSPAVTVRPSRREPVFTRALLARTANLGILEVDANVAAITAGEVHVYGRDETVAMVRAAAAPGVRVRAHGAGMGAALISERADLEAAARVLAEDVVAFDQRGCSSPRVALVVGSPRRGERFAALLDAALGALSRAIPRGRLDDAEARDARRYVETITFAGLLLRGETHAVGFAVGPLLVPPPGRHVHVTVADTLATARACLQPVERLLVAIGTDDATAVQEIVEARVRICQLGEMQRAPLDGPVDLR